MEVVDTSGARVVLNSFPRRVRSSGVTHDPARVVAWDNHVVRIYAAPAGRPEVVLEAVGDWKQVGRQLELTLDDGQALVAEARGGCGCGNVLKRWPYAGLPGS